MSPPFLFILVLSTCLLTTEGFIAPINTQIQISRTTTQINVRTKLPDYDDDIEFFDLDDDDDDDLFDDEYDDYSPSSYNGIIPNPLLDAMDPDGVYERLGPELFSDPIFWRDAVLFCVFLAFFTKDTHHYGTFDSVIEGLENLPADFKPFS